VTEAVAPRVQLRGGPLRYLVSLTLMASAAALVMSQASVREMEARFGSFLATNVFGMRIIHPTDRPVMYLTLPDSGPLPKWIGLVVTPECTVALLIAPLLALAAFLVLGRRLRIRSVLLATALTGAFLVVVNMIRLLVIVVSTHRWGLSAFRWTHEIYGSLISIAGVCIASVFFLKQLSRANRRQAAHSS